MVPKRKVILIVLVIGVLSVAIPCRVRAQEEVARVVFAPSPESLVATAGTDARVIARIVGLNNAVLLVSSVKIPFVRLTGEIYAADVPGCLVKPENSSVHVIGTTVTGEEFVRALSLTVLPAPPMVTETETDVHATADSSLKRYFYDVENHGNRVNGVDITNISSQIKSPARTAGGAELFPAVNSSVNQARTVGTIPHKGLDLDIRSGQSVYAMLGGYVTVYDPSAATVTVATDLDGNGTHDIQIAYVHITPSSGISKGSAVTTATQLGSVNADNHLHISVQDPSGLDLPQLLIWKNKGYNAGKDTDFVKKPRDISNTRIEVLSYGFDVGTRVVSDKVWVVHRKYGATSWITSEMVQDSVDATRWTYDFGTLYRSGETVEYYIMATRQGVDSSIKMYRPMYYNVYLSGGQYASTPPLEYFYFTLY